MLFLMRSAVCIGLVVSALPDRAPSDASPGAAAAVGAAAFNELCRVDAARCRSLADVLLMADPADDVSGARKPRNQPAALPRSAPVL